MPEDENASAAGPGREREEASDIDEEARARERQRDCAERSERAAADVGEDIEPSAYPVSAADLATEYADQPIDMPNETETVGDVFDRLEGEFDSPAQVREALYGAITGEAAGPEEYNRERDLEAIDDEE